MGLDEKSKGVCIYWPDSWTIGVEQNIYMDKTGASASHLEGEEWYGFGKMNADAPFKPKNTSNDHSNIQKPAPHDTPINPPPEIPSDVDETPPEPDERPKRS